MCSHWSCHGYVMNQYTQTMSQVNYVYTEKYINYKSPPPVVAGIDTTAEYFDKVLSTLQ